MSKRTPRKKGSTPLVERDEATGEVLALTKEGLALVTLLAREGQTDGSIAKALGFSPTTFSKLKERDDVLLEQVALGRSELESELTHLLLAQAREGHVVSTIFLLKGRCNWRDTGEVPSGDDRRRTNITIVLPDALSPEQYMRVVNAAPLPAPPKKDES